MNYRSIEIYIDINSTENIAYFCHTVYLNSDVNRDTAKLCKEFSHHFILLSDEYSGATITASKKCFPEKNDMLFSALDGFRKICEEKKDSILPLCKKEELSSLPRLLSPKSYKTP
ncbi:PIR Superfamily Protein [Plasmodium ovale curtisi]|uniref:PIR Superfamily Protein n=1 Tax=Plasmodium ovale curtisi TaxID=864141 RepID=A0A1A8WLU1_PLAOA|nr:PIR Superfamily Protein [Plasmodium ovale curtisi]